MDLHREIILSVISRCKVSAMRDTLSRWGRLSSAQLNNQILRGTKRQIAEQIIQIAKKNAFSDEIVGDLELVYMQLHSRSKTWVVYSLEGRDAHLNLDPRTLRSKVVHHLKLKWKDGPVFGNMKLFSGAVWLRLNLGKNMLQGKAAVKRSKVYNQNNSVFVVMFPGSPYVIINKTGARLLRVVSEAITDAVSAERLEDIKLTGHHVSSLADIVLNKDSKIVLSKYRDREETDNPFIVKQDRKRKAFEECFSGTDDMIDENRQMKHMRRAVLEKKFGSEPQPVLEKLEYRFSVKFHGNQVSDKDCKTSVLIKGKSVLDGLCELTAKGLVKLPLPRHLTTVTQRARNSFTIGARTK